MIKKIRFAIIGTSDISPAHIKAIQRNNYAEVVYIYSRDFQRAKEFANTYNIAPARTYEDILMDKSIDAIDIVTEPNRHAKLALAAIQKGKHVLIEKPLDFNIALAKEVTIAASKSPTITSVISQKRFDPKIKIIKRALDNKTIGNPYLAEVKLMWMRNREYYEKGNGWRGREGNVLINQAIHWIDIALWFFGFPSKIRSSNIKVKKDIACYDTAICCFEFPNNLLFNLVCSTAVNKNEHEVFKIYGTKSVLTYGESLRFRNMRIDKLANLIMSPRTPLQCQIDSFINSIIYNKPPEVSVIDAYNALIVVKSCEDDNKR
ncbi:MAG: Gfo/Idh/MocA family oxidoreductase [Candidatus Omnitrophica bacterium]|nr:Gfo/Idh/MocA family oxidoreductase [Candidatus Omnitrophota bacterium]